MILFSCGVLEWTDIIRQFFHGKLIFKPFFAQVFLQHVIWYFGNWNAMHDYVLTKASVTEM